MKTILEIICYSILITIFIILIVSIIEQEKEIQKQQKIIEAYDQVINEIPNDIFLDVISETDAWANLQELSEPDTTCK